MFSPHRFEEWEIATSKWMKKEGYTKAEITAQLAGIDGQLAIFSALGPAQVEMLPHSDIFAKGKGPIRKNADKTYKITFDASAMCVKRLEAGRMVGIFPEGGIRDGAQSMLSGAEVREGAFLIASRSGCPVVPVVILGSDRLYNIRNWRPWRRANVFIGIGEPVYPAKEKAREQLCQDVCAAVIRLKDQLVSKYQLTEDDLPHSPQERMREP
jgi:hypothetical protein